MRIWNNNTVFEIITGCPCYRKRTKLGLIYMKSILYICIVCIIYCISYPFWLKIFEVFQIWNSYCELIWSNDFTARILACLHNIFHQNSLLLPFECEQTVKNEIESHDQCKYKRNSISVYMKALCFFSSNNWVKRIWPQNDYSIPIDFEIIKVKFSSQKCTVYSKVRLFKAKSYFIVIN